MPHLAYLLATCRLFTSLKNQRKLCGEQNKLSPRALFGPNRIQYQYQYSLLTSLIFWPFLTYPPTLSYLLYNVPFLGGLSWTSLPTLILNHEIYLNRASCLFQLTRIINSFHLSLINMANVMLNVISAYLDQCLGSNKAREPSV